MKGNSSVSYRIKENTGLIDRYILLFSWDATTGSCLPVHSRDVVGDIHRPVLQPEIKVRSSNSNLCLNCCLSLLLFLFRWTSMWRTVYENSINNLEKSIFSISDFALTFHLLKDIVHLSTERGSVCAHCLPGSSRQMMRGNVLSTTVKWALSSHISVEETDATSYKEMRKSNVIY